MRVGLIQALGPMRTYFGLLLFLSLLFCSPAAEASDPSGLIAGLAFLSVAIPFLLGSIVVTARAWSKRKYADRYYTVNQIIVSSIFLVVAVLAFVAVLYTEEGSLHLQEILIMASVLIAPPAIFVIVPWTLHIFQREDVA